MELLARPASELDQRRLTHRNPDLRVTSIDERGAPIPAVRGAAIEPLQSTLLGHSASHFGTALPAPEEPFTARLRITSYFWNFLLASATEPSHLP